MRTYYLLIAMLMLATGCKKETEEIVTLQPTESVDAPVPCYGNDWEFEADYPTLGIALSYNNKIYALDKPGVAMKVYDGVSWQTIINSTPLMTNNGNNNSLNMVAFTIGNKGYILKPDSPSSGFWEFDFLQNLWRRKADFPGHWRDNPSYFTIGNKGYIVGGHWYVTPPAQFLTDTWEYNQLTDTWTQKANTGFIARSKATGFSIGNKGYMVGGVLQFPNGPIYFNNLMEYNPSANSWSMKASFPGESRGDASVFVINDKAYVGGGCTEASIFSSYSAASTVLYRDFYRYNPVTNSWLRVADLPIENRTFFGISINSRGYVVQDFGTYGNGLVQYTPQYCFPGFSPKFKQCNG